jgi:hypothetical protein
MCRSHLALDFSLAAAFGSAVQLLMSTQDTVLPGIPDYGYPGA